MASDVRDKYRKAIAAKGGISGGVEPTGKRRPVLRGTYGQTTNVPAAEKPNLIDFGKAVMQAFMSRAGKLNDLGTPMGIGGGNVVPNFNTQYNRSARFDTEITPPQPGVARNTSYLPGLTGGAAGISGIGRGIVPRYHGRGSPSSNPYYWVTYPQLTPPAATASSGGGGGGYGYGGRGGGGGGGGGYTQQDYQRWLNDLLARWNYE